MSGLSEQVLLGVYETGTIFLIKGININDLKSSNFSIIFYNILLKKFQIKKFFIIKNKFYYLFFLLNNKKIYFTSLGNPNSKVNENEEDHNESHESIEVENDHDDQSEDEEDKKISLKIRLLNLLYKKEFFNDIYLYNLTDKFNLLFATTTKNRLLVFDLDKFLDHHEKNPSAISFNEDFAVDNEEENEEKENFEELEKLKKFINLSILIPDNNLTFLNFIKIPFEPSFNEVFGFVFLLGSSTTYNSVTYLFSLYYFPSQNISKSACLLCHGKEFFNQNNLVFNSNTFNGEKSTYLNVKVKEREDKQKFIIISFYSFSHVFRLLALEIITNIYASHNDYFLRPYNLNYNTHNVIPFGEILGKLIREIFINSSYFIQNFSQIFPNIISHIISRIFPLEMLQILALSYDFTDIFTSQNLKDGIIKILDNLNSLNYQKFLKQFFNNNHSISYSESLTLLNKWKFKLFLTENFIIKFFTKDSLNNSFFNYIFKQISNENINNFFLFLLNNDNSVLMLSTYALNPIETFTNIDLLLFLLENQISFITLQNLEDLLISLPLTFLPNKLLTLMSIIIEKNYNKNLFQVNFKTFYNIFQECLRRILFFLNISNSSSNEIFHNSQNIYFILDLVEYIINILSNLINSFEKFSNSSHSSSSLPNSFNDRYMFLYKKLFNEYLNIKKNLKLLIFSYSCLNYSFNSLDYNIIFKMGVKGLVFKIFYTLKEYELVSFIQNKIEILCEDFDENTDNLIVDWLDLTLDTYQIVTQEEENRAENINDSFEYYSESTNVSSDDNKRNFSKSSENESSLNFKRQKFEDNLEIHDISLNNDIDQNENKICSILRIFRIISCIKNQTILAESLLKIFQIPSIEMISGDVGFSISEDSQQPYIIDNFIARRFSDDYNNLSVSVAFELYNLTTSLLTKVSTSISESLHEALRLFRMRTIARYYPISNFNPRDQEHLESALKIIMTTCNIHLKKISSNSTHTYFGSWIGQYSRNNTLRNLNYIEKTDKFYGEIDIIQSIQDGIMFAKDGLSFRINIFPPLFKILTSFLIDYTYDIESNDFSYRTSFDNIINCIPSIYQKQLLEDSILYLIEEIDVYNKRLNVINGSSIDDLIVRNIRLIFIRELNKIWSSKVSEESKNIDDKYNEDYSYFYENLNEISEFDDDFDGEELMNENNFFNSSLLNKKSKLNKKKSNMNLNKEKNILIEKIKLFTNSLIKVLEIFNEKFPIESLSSTSFLNSLASSATSSSAFSSIISNFSSVPSSVSSGLSGNVSDQLPTYISPFFSINLLLQDIKRLKQLQENFNLFLTYSDLKNENKIKLIFSILINKILVEWDYILKKISLNNNKFKNTNFLDKIKKETFLLFSQFIWLKKISFTLNFPLYSIFYSIIKNLIKKNKKGHSIEFSKLMFSISTSGQININDNYSFNKFSDSNFNNSIEFDSFSSCTDNSWSYIVDSASLLCYTALTNDRINKNYGYFANPLSLGGYSPSLFEFEAYKTSKKLLERSIVDCNSDVLSGVLDVFSMTESVLDVYKRLENCVNFNNEENSFQNIYSNNNIIDYNDDLTSSHIPDDILDDIFSFSPTFECPPPYSSKQGLLMKDSVVLPALTKFTIEEFQTRNTKLNFFEENQITTQQSSSNALDDLVKVFSQYESHNLSLQFMLKSWKLNKNKLLLLEKNFLSIIKKNLNYYNINKKLTIAYLSSLSFNTGINELKLLIPSALSDFKRLKTISFIGEEISSLWNLESLIIFFQTLGVCSYWWDILINILKIKIDLKLFQTSDLIAKEKYLASLIPHILKNSRYNLKLTLDFCRSFKISLELANFLYIKFMLLENSNDTFTYLNSLSCFDHIENTSTNNLSNSNFTSALCGVSNNTLTRFFKFTTTLKSSASGLSEKKLIKLLRLILPNIHSLEYEKISFVSTWLLDLTHSLDEDENIYKKSRNDLYESEDDNDNLTHYSLNNVYDKDKKKEMLDYFDEIIFSSLPENISLPIPTLFLSNENFYNEKNLLKFYYNLTNFLMSITLPLEIKKYFINSSIFSSSYHMTIGEKNKKISSNSFRFLFWDLLKTPWSFIDPILQVNNFSDSLETTNSDNVSSSLLSKIIPLCLALGIEKEEIKIREIFIQYWKTRINKNYSDYSILASALNNREFETQNTSDEMDDTFIALISTKSSKPKIANNFLDNSTNKFLSNFLNVIFSKINDEIFNSWYKLKLFLWFYHMERNISCYGIIPTSVNSSNSKEVIYHSDLSGLFLMKAHEILLSSSQVNDEVSFESYDSLKQEIFILGFNMDSNIDSSIKDSELQLKEIKLPKHSSVPKDELLSSYYQKIGYYLIIENNFLLIEKLLYKFVHDIQISSSYSSLLLLSQKFLSLININKNILNEKKRETLESTFSDFSYLIISLTIEYLWKFQVNLANKSFCPPYSYLFLKVAPIIPIINEINKIQQTIEEIIILCSKVDKFTEIYHQSNLIEESKSTNFISYYEKLLSEMIYRLLIETDTDNFTSNSNPETNSFIYNLNNEDTLLLNNQRRKNEDIFFGFSLFYLLILISDNNIKKKFFVMLDELMRGKIKNFKRFNIKSRLRSSIALYLFNTNKSSIINSFLYTEDISFYFHFLYCLSELQEIRLGLPEETLLSAFGFKLDSSYQIHFIDSSYSSDNTNNLISSTFNPTNFFTPSLSLHNNFSNHPGRSLVLTWLHDEVFDDLKLKRFLELIKDLIFLTNLNHLDIFALLIEKLNKKSMYSSILSTLILLENNYLIDMFSTTSYSQSSLTTSTSLISSSNEFFSLLLFSSISFTIFDSLSKLLNSSVLKLQNFLDDLKLLYSPSSNKINSIKSKNYSWIPSIFGLNFSNNNQFNIDNLTLSRGKDLFSTGYGFLQYNSSSISLISTPRTVNNLKNLINHSSIQLNKDDNEKCLKIEHDFSSLLFTITSCLKYLSLLIKKNTSLTNDLHNENISLLKYTYEIIVELYNQNFEQYLAFCTKQYNENNLTNSSDLLMTYCNYYTELNLFFSNVIKNLYLIFYDMNFLDNITSIDSGYFAKIFNEALNLLTTDLQNSKTNQFSTYTKLIFLISNILLLKNSNEILINFLNFSIENINSNKDKLKIFIENLINILLIDEIFPSINSIFNPSTSDQSSITLNEYFTFISSIFNRKITSSIKFIEWKKIIASWCYSNISNSSDIKLQNFGLSLKEYLQSLSNFYINKIKELV